MQKVVLLLPFTTSKHLPVMSTNQSLEKFTKYFLFPADRKYYRWLVQAAGGGRARRKLRQSWTVQRSHQVWPHAEDITPPAREFIFTWEWTQMSLTSWCLSPSLSSRLCSTSVRVLCRMWRIGGNQGLVCRGGQWPCFIGSQYQVIRMMAANINRVTRSLFGFVFPFYFPVYVFVCKTVDLKLALAINNGECFLRDSYL